MPRNERLRQLRIKHRWRQQDVADQLGIALVTVQRWERGFQQPSAYYRLKLSALFGLSTQELGLLEAHPSRASAENKAREVARLGAAASDELALWMVPYARNPYFTGRNDLLELLRQQFSPQGSVQPTSLRQAALTQARAIKGLGGVGKTQIALEYAYRAYEQGRYTHTIWLNAASEGAIIASLLALAELAQVSETDQSKQVAAIIRWLEACAQPWLLIVDNADELSFLPSYLPTRGNGHILLTTRASAVGELAPSIEVDCMSLMEGRQLLLRRAQREGSDAEMDEATTIVVALAQFPLALDQAGAYIDETGCSLHDYFQLYQQHRYALLARRGKQATHYPESVATTWSLSFQHVKQNNPAAAELLRLCSFLAPDAIPEAILTSGVAEVGPVLGQALADSFLLNEAIQVLRRYSLIKRDPKARVLNMHRLVQVVLKENLNQATGRQWAEQTVRVVSRAFPKVSRENWPRCELCLPHVRACAELADEYHLSFPEGAHLFHQAGSYLYARGLYAQAEPLFLRALTLREQLLGSEHPDTASTLQALADLYYRQGKYEQVEPLLKRVLAIRQQVLGPEHPAIADTLSALGSLYGTLGKYAQGEPLLQQALMMNEQQLGPGHTNTMRDLHNLAFLYRLQGKYEQAEPLLRRALAISKQQDDEWFAWLLSQLALLLYLRGHYKQAEPLYQRALAMCEDILGAMHPRTATCLHDLGVLYAKLGKEEQAEALYQRALSIREQVVGPTHKHFAQSLHDIASLYQMQGGYEQAEELYQRALAIQEYTLGPEHPDTAQTLTNLGVLYAKLGKEEQAEALYLRALAIYKRIPGPEHPDLATSLTNLANLYSTQDRIAEAEVLYQRALHIRQEQLGQEHSDVALSLKGLANLYTRQRKYTQAGPLYLRALRIVEQQLGPEHAETANILHDFAGMQQAQGQTREAEALYQRALVIREHAFGVNSP